MLELSEEQLKHLNKDALVIIAASLQNQLRSMAHQLENANVRLDDNNRQIELLTEQIRLMNQRHFGKKAESGLNDMEGQLTLFDSFNEAEGFQKKDLAEPTIEEVTISSYRRSKTKGKREADLTVFPPESLNTDFLMKNSTKNFQMATRNFRWKSTSVCISFRKPLLLMSITFMSMLPKAMTAPLSGLNVL